MILGYAAEVSRKQAQKLAAEQLLPLNQGKLTPMATVTLGNSSNVFRAERASHVEAIHAQTVSLHAQLSPQTCIWSETSLRHLDSRYSNFCAEQVRLRFGMGSLQPSSQFDVEGFCQRKEVGTLCRGQSDRLESIYRRRSRFAGEQHLRGASANVCWLRFWNRSSDDGVIGI